MIRHLIFLFLTLHLSASFDFEDPCIQFNPGFLSATSPSTSKEESSDVFLSVDFLYWEGLEKGLEYAVKNSTSSFDQNLEIYEPGFGFHPAFRLGIGSRLPHDHWNVDLFYTRYFSSIEDSRSHDFSGNPQAGIRSIWTSSTAFSGSNFRALWQNVSAKWKLNTNIVDLFLSHPFLISRNLFISPAFGLKFAIIQQNYQVLYKNGNSAFDVNGNGLLIQFESSQINMKNRSFNLGMGTKVECGWSLSDHFDLIGKFSLALLSSHFSVGRNEFDVSTNPVNGDFFESFRQNDNFWTIRPTSSLLLGFGWSHFLSRPKKVVRLGLNASYEATCYWKQNMLFRFIDETNSAMLSSAQGDLFFHGLTLEGTVDF